MKLLIKHSPPCLFVTLSLLGPNIFLSTLFSNTLSLCSTLSVTDQASHSYKKETNIFLYYFNLHTFG